MSCYIFSAKQPIRHREGSHCEPFETKYLNRYQNVFLNPKRYNEHFALYSFLYASSPRGG